MSGICGLIDFGAGFTGKKLSALMAQMQHAMIHRGFERDSLWMGEQTQIALSDCHLLTSRTAVLANSASHIQIVYDGDALAATHGAAVELNQHPPVLAELARVFADPTKSPIDALRAIETPFALVLWNDRLKKLLLARDAFDSKPLYFASGRGWFAFASELRALKVIPGFDATLDQDAINEYVVHGTVTAPRSMYQGARKVCAGGFVELDCAPLLASGSLISIREGDPAASGVVTMLAPLCGELHSSHFCGAQLDHDSPNATSIRAPTNLAQLTLSEQIELLRRTLLDSLQNSRFRSSSVHVMSVHRPVDALLAAMCRLELQLETHTYAVADPLYADNSTLSTDIAQHLGAIHHQGETLEDFPELLNRVARALDEPMGSLDALVMNSNAAFLRANSSHALSGVGTIRPVATPTMSFIEGVMRRKPTTTGSPSQTQPQSCNIALLNQISAHHSLAVATPFLNHHVTALLSAPVTGLATSLVHPFAQQTSMRHLATMNSDMLAHMLRQYLPEPLIMRIMQHNNSTMLPHAEKALAQLCESSLFNPQSQVCQLTNRIALRGLLASPAVNAHHAAQRRWSLLVLECWLRRQTA
ncbi:MAG: hypothetical protein EXS12_04990 [Phycisphaerales bacterium]|nr:hypothetical protein [Phycisphaerales bacterium]